MERHGTSSAALTEESEAFPQVGQAVGCVASGLGLEKRGVAARNQPQAPIPFCGSPCPSGPPGLRESQPHPQEWLLIEWPKTDQEPTKYWFSTLPPETKLADLVRIAKHRWIIERDYEELKQELGLGHFEGRGWRGFHQHGTLCIAAYGFLVAERNRFSPSARVGHVGLPRIPVLPEQFRPARLHASESNGIIQPRSRPFAFRSRATSST